MNGQNHRIALQQYANLTMSSYLRLHPINSSCVINDKSIILDSFAIALLKTVLINAVQML